MSRTMSRNAKLLLNGFCVVGHFSKSLMVSIANSKLGCSKLFFVEHGVKVDGRYYRKVLLKQQTLTSHASHCR